MDPSDPISLSEENRARNVKVGYTLEKTQLPLHMYFPLSNRKGIQ